MIMILGASGFIGNFLFNRLKEEGFTAAGTYFRNKKEGLIYFDLENMRPDELKLEKRKIRYMVMAAAVNANIDDSKRDWEKSYNANVLKTGEVMDWCFENSVIPVYLSTDNVFDGEKGDYREEDRRNPINCYGRIRYETENHLLNSERPYIILRMGKVFGTQMEDGTLITGMIKALRDGRKLMCADDQVFTPLYIRDLFDSLKILISGSHCGVFHLASVKPTTRYEIAKTAERHFRFKNADIIPVKINSLGLVEKRPVSIDLNSNKFRDTARSEEKELTYYLDLIKESGQ